MLLSQNKLCVDNFKKIRQLVIIKYSCNVTLQIKELCIKVTPHSANNVCNWQWSQLAEFDYTCMRIVTLATNRIWYLAANRWQILRCARHSNCQQNIRIKILQLARIVRFFFFFFVQWKNFHHNLIDAIVG